MLRIAKDKVRPSAVLCAQVPTLGRRVGSGAHPSNGMGVFYFILFFTCQAAGPLQGGGGIQLLRVLVLLGRVHQAFGGRQGGVGAKGGAQLVNGRRRDSGLHGGGRGHADRGQAGRGHHDVDGRAGAVGLGQAAG